MWIIRLIRDTWNAYADAIARDLTRIHEFLRRR